MLNWRCGIRRDPKPVNAGALAWLQVRAEVDVAAPPPHDALPVCCWRKGEKGKREETPPPPPAQLCQSREETGRPTPPPSPAAASSVRGLRSGVENRVDRGGSGGGPAARCG